MSEYYKQIRRIILRQFENFGSFKRIKFISHGILSVISLFMMISCMLGTNDSHDESPSLFLFFAVIGLFFGRVAYSSKKEYYDKRKETVDFIINRLNMNEDITNILIKEINKYIKKVKTASTWFIGIAVSLFVLPITVFSNSVQKIMDIIIKLYTNEELKSFLFSSNILQKENILDILQMIFVYFIIIVGNIMLS